MILIRKCQDASGGGIRMIDGRIDLNISDDELKQMQINGILPQNGDYRELLNNLANRFYYRQKLLDENIESTKNTKSVKNSSGKESGNGAWYKNIDRNELLNQIYETLRTTPIYDAAVTYAKNNNKESLSPEEIANIDKSAFSGLDKVYNMGYNFTQRFNTDKNNKVIGGLNGKANLGYKKSAMVFGSAYDPKNLPRQYNMDAVHEMNHVLDLALSHKNRSFSPSMAKMELIKNEMGDAYYVTDPSKLTNLQKNYIGSSAEGTSRDIAEFFEYRLPEAEKIFNELKSNYSPLQMLQFWYNFYNLHPQSKNFKENGKYYEFWKKRDGVRSPEAMERILNEVAQNNTENVQHNIGTPEFYYAKNGGSINYNKNIKYFK